MALRKARVQTLILTTDADHHHTLLFGEDPSALATGAGVQVVPHQSEQSPQSGLGAVLRHADSEI